MLFLSLGEKMKILAPIFLFVFVLSCNAISSNINIQDSKEMRDIQFEEERRLNKDFSSKDVFIINSIEEVMALYVKLNDPSFKRSAPIPALNTDESLLVLKPRLSSKMPYADLEVVSLKADAKSIFVKYKEIENSEYQEDKKTHPVLILKIQSQPKQIKLEKIN